MTAEPFPDRFRRWYATLPPAIRVLMTVNAVLYLAWVIVRLFGLGFAQRFTFEFLALNAIAPEILLRPWQVLTYGFLHLQPGIWGFIAFGFNMLWLYWLGRDYEELYGSHQLFGLYMLSALGGGLFAAAGAFVFADAGIPVAGALGAVLGVVCGVATLNPNRGIGLLIIGVIPMKWVAIGFLFLAVLFASGMWPYLLAYLGAAATGFGFAKAQQAGRELGAWARPLFRRSVVGFSVGSTQEGAMSRMQGWISRRKERAGPSASAPRGGSFGREAHTTDDAPRESDVVDSLLDKISEKGYEALTDDEKRVLYDASRND